MRYRDTMQCVRAPLLSGWFVLSAVALASAQTTTEAALAELRGLLERQQAVLAEQARLIEAQGRNLQALQEELGQTRQLVQAVRSTGDGAGTSAAAEQATVASTTATNAQDPQRAPELPAVVSAGDFPG